MARYSTGPWDFDVDSVAVTPTTVEEGDSVTVNVRIKNTGDELGTVKVVLGVDRPSGRHYPDAKTLYDIPVGGTKTATFTYRPSAGPGTYTVNADVYNPQETHFFDTSGFSHSFQVSAPQHDPTAARAQPSDSEPDVPAGQTQTFRVNVADDDCDLYYVEWYLDDAYQTTHFVDGCSDSDSWSHAFSAGFHDVVAVVFDDRNQGGHTDDVWWGVTAEAEVQPKPSLVDAATSPGSHSVPSSGTIQVEPGDRIRGWYQVHNPRSQSVTVTLGMSVVDSTDRENVDEAHDDSCTVPAGGKKWCNRYFDLPADLPEGEADVLLAIWTHPTSFQSGEQYDGEALGGNLQVLSQGGGDDGEDGAGDDDGGGDGSGGDGGGDGSGGDGGTGGGGGGSGVDAPDPALVASGASPASHSTPTRGTLEVEPGDRIRGWFRVFNPGGQSVTVTLGMSVVDRMDRENVDEAHDDPCTVPAGTHKWCNRYFDLPADLPEGEADVLLAIWKHPTDFHSGDRYDGETLEGRLRVLPAAGGDGGGSGGDGRGGGDGGSGGGGDGGGGDGGSDDGGDGGTGDDDTGDESIVSLTIQSALPEADELFLLAGEKKRFEVVAEAPTGSKIDRIVWSDSDPGELENDGCSWSCGRVTSGFSYEKDPLDTTTYRLTATVHDDSGGVVQKTWSVTVAPDPTCHHQDETVSRSVRTEPWEFSLDVSRASASASLSGSARLGEPRIAVSGTEFCYERFHSGIGKVKSASLATRIETDLEFALDIKASAAYESDWIDLPGVTPVSVSVGSGSAGIVPTFRVHLEGAAEAEVRLSQSSTADLRVSYRDGEAHLATPEVTCRNGGTPPFCITLDGGLEVQGHVSLEFGFKVGVDIRGIAEATVVPYAFVHLDGAAATGSLAADGVGGGGCGGFPYGTFPSPGAWVAVCAGLGVGAKLEVLKFDLYDQPGHEFFSEMLLGTVRITPGGVHELHGGDRLRLQATLAGSSPGNSDLLTWHLSDGRCGELRTQPDGTATYTAPPEPRVCQTRIEARGETLVGDLDAVDVRTTLAAPVAAAVTLEASPSALASAGGAAPTVTTQRLQDGVTVEPVRSAASGSIVKLRVASESHEGSIVAIEAEDEFWNWEDPNRMRVLLDGERVAQARDYDDLVRDQSADGEAQYLVVKGSSGTQILVWVPHFSERTIEVAALEDGGTAFVTPGGLLFLLALVVVVAWAAYRLGRRRAETPSQAASTVDASDADDAPADAPEEPPEDATEEGRDGADVGEDEADEERLDEEQEEEEPMLSFS